MSRSLSLTVRSVAGSIVAAAALTACAAGGGPAWTYAPLGPTPGATGSPAPTGSPGTSPTGSPGGTVVEVEETGDLRILIDGQHASELRVTAGQTYTFRVTNTAGFVHDFYLGPPDRLETRDVADLPGVPEFTQGTQEFTWTATADAQGWQFACTVPGHYGPMHGDLVPEGG